MEQSLKHETALGRWGTARRAANGAQGDYTDGDRGHGEERCYDGANDSSGGDGDAPMLRVC